LTLGTIPNFFC